MYCLLIIRCFGIKNKFGVYAMKSFALINEMRYYDVLRCNSDGSGGEFFREMLGVVIIFVILLRYAFY